MYGITTGSTKYAINLHVKDVGHALIFGPIGAGKSTALSFIAMQAQRYRSRPRPDGSTVPATIMGLDKDRAMYASCSAAGGTHYDIGTEDSGGLALCPLEGIDTPAERLWAQDWVETCYSLQTGKSFVPGQKKEVANAISLLSNTSKQERSLDHFLLKLQDRETADAMAHYASDKGMGHILNGTNDPLRISNFTVFEIDELMKLGDKNALPVLLYIFRKFERSLTGQPAFMLCDEGWVMLGHPVIKERFRGWLKEMRRKNCSVVLATQSLSDATRSGLIDVLIESCATRILLPNPEADTYGTDAVPGPADFYEAFGLTKDQINEIKNATPKSDYYLTSPLGNSMFQLALGPLASSFVGANDKDSIREIRLLENRFGRDWPVQWMKKRGIDYEKYIRTEAKYAA
jgi:type IV secretion system protein VirB4